jgi:hypothetical protein
MTRMKSKRAPTVHPDVETEKLEFHDVSVEISSRACGAQPSPNTLSGMSNAIDVSILPSCARAPWTVRGITPPPTARVVVNVTFLMGSMPMVTKTVKRRFQPLGKRF